MRKEDLPKWTLGHAPQNDVLPITAGVTLGINAHEKGEEITIAIIPGQRIHEAKIMCLAPEMLNVITEVMKSMPTLSILIEKHPDDRMRNKGLDLLEAIANELSKIPNQLKL